MNAADRRIHYRQDAAYELAGVDARIASTKRSAVNVSSRQSAEIADAVLPSLERRAAELRELVATLPERPARVSHDAGAAIQFPTHPTPLTAAELAGLDLPEFLRRAS